MRIISRKRIREAAIRHERSATELDAWYRVMKAGRFANFAELKAAFQSADKVGEYHVFNVGGGRLRVICAVHFNTGRVYIRGVLTHAEYDRDAWKK